MNLFSIIQPTSMNLGKILGCVFVATSCNIASAQGTDDHDLNFKKRIGFYGSVIFPLGDMSDEFDAGMGFSLTWEYPFNKWNKLAARTRLDYLGYSKEDKDGHPQVKTTLNTWGLGIDSILRLTKNNHIRGLYIFAGVGAMYNISKQEIASYESYDKKDLNPVGNVGFGINFTSHFLVEGRYVYNKSTNMDYSFAQVSLGIRM